MRVWRALNFLHGIALGGFFWMKMRFLESEAQGVARSAIDCAGIWGSEAQGVARGVLALNFAKV